MTESMQPSAHHHAADGNGGVHRQQIDGRSVGPRSVGLAIRRGLRRRCPACGEGNIYRAYLKIVDHCPSCGEALYHHRADDAPPYFTIAILGHVIVALVLAVEMAYHPPLWVHETLWLPLTVVLALLMLPVVKGALVGLQWALLMHGFDPNYSEESEFAEFAPLAEPRKPAST